MVLTHQTLPIFNSPNAAISLSFKKSLAVKPFALHICYNIMMNKKMKIKELLPILLAGCIVIGLTSCQNDDEPKYEENNLESVSETSLCKILSEIFESNDSQKDYYIVFDSSTQEFLVLSTDEYEIGQAFAELVVSKDSSNIHKAPKGPGWKFAGSGKGKFNAIKLANKLSKEIPADRDFEIHVERGKDGSYKVWYRLV